MLHNNPEERSSKISTRLCKAVFRKQPVLGPTTGSSTTLERPLKNTCYSPALALGEPWLFQKVKFTMKRPRLKDVNKQDRQRMYNRTLRRVRANRCCSGKAMSITQPECVCVSYPHAMHMHCIIICGLTRSTVFFHIIS